MVENISLFQFGLAKQVFYSIYSQPYEIITVLQYYSIF